MITVNTKSFAEAVKKASRFVGKKTTLPVIKEFLIRVKGNVGEVFSTNLEEYFITPFEASGDDVEFVFVESGLVVKALPFFGTTFTAEYDPKEEEVTLKSGSKTMVRDTLPAEEMPPFPFLKDTSITDLPFKAPEVLRVYKLISHSVGTNDGRPILKTIFIKDGCAYATDGFEASVAPTSQSGEILVPDELCKHLDLFPFGSKISQSVQGYLVEGGGNRLLSTIYFPFNATYPDISKVVPSEKKEYDVNTFNRVELIDALKYLDGVSEKGVVIRTLKEGALGAKSAQGDASVDLSGIFGAKPVAFDGIRLANILKQFNTETINIHIWAYNQPIRIQSSGDTGYSMLMPMTYNFKEEVQ